MIGRRLWQFVSRGTGDWRLMKASARRSFIWRASKPLGADTLVFDSLYIDDKAPVEQRSSPN